MVGRRHLAGQLPERQRESAMQFARAMLAAGIVALAAAAWNIHAQDTVSKEQYDLLMREVSNRGRWGAEDELGTVNLITPSRRIAAARLVMDGITLSLAHETLTDETADNPNPYTHSIFTIEAAPEWFFDRIEVGYHGFVHSHLDALCHRFYDGETYNGHPIRAVDEAGCNAAGITAMGDGIFTRAVLVDLPRLRGVPWLEPGTAIYSDELDAWERQFDTSIEAGDVVLFRTGRWARREALGPWNVAEATAGLHYTTASWLHERDVAVVGSDAVTDVSPSGVENNPWPLHTLLLVAMGTPIFDSLDLEAVAEYAAAAERWEFAIATAPLRIPGGTGSPLNPIAIF